MDPEAVFRLIRTLDGSVIGEAAKDETFRRDFEHVYLEVRKVVMEREKRKLNVAPLPGQADRKKKKHETAEDLWYRMIDEMNADLSVAVATERAAPPDTQNALGSAIYYANVLSACSYKSGQAWERLTLFAEQFLKRVINAAEPGRNTKPSTVRRRGPTDPTYKVIDAKWKEANAPLSWTTIVDMLPVGALMREFPAVQRFSSPREIVKHIKEIGRASCRERV